MQRIQKTVKTNDYQLRQIIKKLTGLPEVMNGEYATINDVLAYCGTVGAVQFPFSIDDLFITYERIPVLGSLAHPKRAPLIAMLLERFEETGLVVDSIISGQESVRFAKIIQTNEEIITWVQHMSKPDFMVRPIVEDYSIIVAPLSTFIHQT